MESTRRFLLVYYDSKCEFCRCARDFAQRRDLTGRLEFMDYRSCEDAAIPATERFGALHVFDADGTWHSGYAAVVKILSVLPRLRWLASVMALPPFTWVGPAAYRLVSRNRTRLSAWVARAGRAPAPCAECCGEAPQLSSSQSVMPNETSTGQSSPTRLQGDSL